MDGLETKAERIRLQIERIESDPELAQLQDELKQLLRQKDDEGKNRYRAEAELENAQHAVHAEQAWLDMHGDSDFDDAALSDMVSNLLADTYETCFDTSRPQERPQRIAGGFDREGTAPFDVRVLRRIGNTVRARLQQIDERAVQLRADTERAMGDYLKHHSTEGDTVMASVEDYPYFLDELKNLNMLVTRAATDEEYANSVEKLYMSFQQLNRAFNTDEENVREQLDRINGMLKGQQFGPRGGRLSLHVDFHPIDRQFKSSLGRIMSKLDDWTRNARSNPMETRKAFAGCETFIGRLQAELGQIRDTNGIKEYGARNLDPRVRSSFYAIVHHNDLPDERISSTGGKSGGALQELTSFVYGAALIYLLGGDLTGKPTYTTLFLDEALIKADGRYTKRALTVLPRLASRSSYPRRKAKPPKSSASQTRRTWHTRIPQPATRTCRSSTASRQRKPKHKTPPSSRRNPRRRHNMAAARDTTGETDIRRKLDEYVDAHLTRHMYDTDESWPLRKTIRLPKQAELEQHYNQIRAQNETIRDWARQHHCETSEKTKISPADSSNKKARSSTP